MTPNPSLGQRISARRKQVGLSQEELARRAGITERTLRDVERDRRGAYFHTVAALAEVLGTPLDELAGHRKSSSGLAESEDSGGLKALIYR